MDCGNKSRDKDGRLICKATGYRCGFVPSDRSDRSCPCLFDQRFLKSEKMKQMIASIRAVKPGSRIWIIFRTSSGWGTRVRYEGSTGNVISVDEYGKVEAEIAALRGTWDYRPEDFTRTIFLNREEQEESLAQMEDDTENEERIRKEGGAAGEEAEVW